MACSKITGTQHTTVQEIFSIVCSRHVDTEEGVPDAQARTSWQRDFRIQQCPHESGSLLIRAVIKREIYSADSNLLHTDSRLEPSCDKATGIRRQDHRPCEPTERSLATAVGCVVPITTTRTRRVSQTTRMEEASRALLGPERSSRTRPDGRSADQHGEATQGTTREGW